MVISSNRLGFGSLKRKQGSTAAMDYSVADAIASGGGDAATGGGGDISAILPFGIAPGAKVVMRREKLAAEQAWSYVGTGDTGNNVNSRYS